MNNEEEALLLKRFNGREKHAFGEVYLMFYDNLIYFCAGLYRNTSVHADDVVQDVFLCLWENASQKFSGLVNIKAYLFVSIKNRFKDYLKHQKHIHKYRESTLIDEDYLVAQVVETEVFSFLEEALRLLPEECKRSFAEYLNGLEVKEIAIKLNKSEFTIYKQRKNAIEILRSKFPKNKLMLLLSFFNI